MADANLQAEDAFIELINTYPSPHNGQPMVLKKKKNAENSFEVYFDTSRGLTATKISYLFSFVTIGVFFRHSELSAQALGHTVTLKRELPAVQDMSSGNLIYCGDMTISYDTQQPNKQVHEALLRRQTSRKKYTAKLSDYEEQHIVNLAEAQNMQATFVKPSTAQKVIWLNQRAVFDDMFDPAVRAELQHWLRFSPEEKQAKRDGLAYDCMELSGNALHFFAKHYKLLRWPVVSWLLKQYYMRTMKDTSSLGYVLAPFSTEQHAYDIGRLICDIWESISENGHYLHPFGTIVSNTQAHADFASLVGVENETRTGPYVVFIFRAGSSVAPVRSLRLPAHEHLLQQEGE